MTLKQASMPLISLVLIFLIVVLIWLLKSLRQPIGAIPPTSLATQTPLIITASTQLKSDPPIITTASTRSSTLSVMSPSRGYGYYADGDKVFLSLAADEVAVRFLISNFSPD